jgi:hypothetical protein
MASSSRPLWVQTLLTEAGPGDPVSWIEHSFLPAGGFHRQKNHGRLARQASEAAEPSLTSSRPELDTTLYGAVEAPTKTTERPRHSIGATAIFRP